MDDDQIKRKRPNTKNVNKMGSDSNDNKSVINCKICGEFIQYNDNSKHSQLCGKYFCLNESNINKKNKINNDKIDTIQPKVELMSANSKTDKSVKTDSITKMEKTKVEVDEQIVQLKEWTKEILGNNYDNNDELLKKHKKTLLSIKKKMDANTISLEKIISSDAFIDDKVKMFEYFHYMNNVVKYSDEWFESRDMINDLLKSAKDDMENIDGDFSGKKSNNEVIGEETNPLIVELLKRTLLQGLMSGLENMNDDELNEQFNDIDNKLENKSGNNKSSFDDFIQNGDDDDDDNIDPNYTPVKNPKNTPPEIKSNKLIFKIDKNGKLTNVDPNDTEVPEMVKDLFGIRKSERIEKMKKDEVEKMKLIKKEMPKIINKQNVGDILAYIKSKNIPDISKDAIERQLDLYANSNPFNGGDSGKVKIWLEYACRIPDELKPPPKIDLKQPPDVILHTKKIRDVLNKNIFGMATAKEEMLEFILHNLSTNGSTKILGLCGPPGIGKTELCRSLAEILDLPMIKIPLGGISDSSALIGHSSTYVGSVPGKIVKGMIQAKYNNPIIFFDEVDKVSTKHSDEINGVLTHLIDETQNCEFIDEYLDFPIDVSKCLFVFAFNYIDKIDPIVKDRMDIIHLAGYSTDDKINIAQNFLIPSAMKNIGFQSTDIIFTKEILRKIIDEFSPSKIEKGVRSLKRQLYGILKRLNAIKLTDNNYDECKLPSFSIPYTLSINDYEILKRVREDSKSDDIQIQMYL